MKNRNKPSVDKLERLFISDYISGGLLIGRTLSIAAYKEYISASGLKERKVAYAALNMAWGNQLEDFARVVNAVYQKKTSGQFLIGLERDSPTVPKIFNKCKTAEEIYAELGLERGLKKLSHALTAEMMNGFYQNFFGFKDEWLESRHSLNRLKHGRMVVIDAKLFQPFVDHKFLPEHLYVVHKNDVNELGTATKANANKLVRKAHTLVTELQQVLAIYLATYHPTSLRAAVRSFQSVPMPEIEGVLGPTAPLGMC